MTIPRKDLSNREAAKEFLSRFSYGRKAALSLIPKARYIAELIGKIGDDVVILAAGPSLPKTDCWSARRYTTIALNRAVFVHKTDYLFLSTDSIKIDHKDFRTLIGATTRTTRIVLQNYFYTPRKRTGAALQTIQRKDENVSWLSTIANPVYVCADIVGVKYFATYCGLDKAGVDLEVEKEKAAQIYNEDWFPNGFLFGPSTILISAIEFCRYCGAKRVHVFGHDAKRRGEKRYCSEKIPHDPITTKKFDDRSGQMQRAMKFCNDVLWRGRIEIVNYCPDSGTDCIIRKPIGEFPYMGLTQ